MQPRALSIVRPRAQPVAAPTGRAAREIPLDRWVDHPGYGVTPQRLVHIYRTAEAGSPQQQCDLFDDLAENDGHLRNLFEQRAQAVAGKPWVVQGDGDVGDTQLASRVLSEALRALPMVGVLEHQLGFNFYGWAASEIDWGIMRIEGRDWVVPVWLANVPARRFAIKNGSDELRLVTADEPSVGAELQPGKWLVTRRSGVRVARAGLMRTAAWYACFKRFATRDWVIYAEKYGLPLTIAKYEDGLGGAGQTDDHGRLAAVEIVENIGNDGGAVVPKSVDVEIHEAGRTGDSSGVHGGLIAHCNAEMSKLINGGTLSNDNAGSGGASYALGEVHASTRWDSVQADGERVQESFRLQLCAAFMRFNGLSGPPPLLKIQVVRDLEPRARAEVADIYVNKLGGKASLAQLAQELGMKAPLDDADTAAGPVESPPVAAPREEVPA